MASILERLDGLIRGSLHRFVDRALENDSLLLYDQDVRDMEAAIDHLEEATTGMYAAARANERRLERHRDQLQKLEQRLERMVAEGVGPTSEQMITLQAELDVKRAMVAETQSQIERQQNQYETLRKRLAETDVMARTLKDERPRLESLIALARAYRSVERVELTLDGLRGLGGDTEVAMVADSIYKRFNAAQARLDLIREVDDLEMLVELERVEVEDQLDERRRRLGLAPEEETAPPTETTTEPQPDVPDAPDPSPPDAEPPVYPVG
jgi:phage shock protein A